MVDEQHSPDDDKDDDSEDDHDHLYIIGRFCLSVCVSVTFFLNFWEVQKLITTLFVSKRAILKHILRRGLRGKEGG